MSKWFENEFESRPDRQSNNKSLQNPVDLAFMGFFNSLKHQTMLNNTKKVVS